MSFGNIAGYEAVAAMNTGNGASGTRLTTQQTARLQSAFNTQMRMAQSLFGEGSSYGEGSSSGGLDMSLINDATMMEALATISRLMRSEAGLPTLPSAPMTTQTKTVAPQAAAAKIDQSVSLTNLGSLSARFESGDNGVATIGYDRVGGTSYGKYQIASKPGTMDRFLSYLDAQAPDLAQRLRDSGPADTGSKTGDMPETWQAIAQEQPGRFETLQHDFIAKETYAPARDMILKRTGLDFNNAPPALREVLWSTSVQHGPTGAAKIFGRVIDQFVGKAEDGTFHSQLIDGVYESRKGQFGSSTRRVQQAVSNRMDEEKQIALNMLGKTRLNTIV